MGTFGGQIFTIMDLLAQVLFVPVSEVGFTSYALKSALTLAHCMVTCRVYRLSLTNSETKETDLFLTILVEVLSCSRMGLLGKASFCYVIQQLKGARMQPFGTLPFCCIRKVRSNSNHFKSKVPSQDNHFYKYMSFLKLLSVAQDMPEHVTL